MSWNGGMAGTALPKTTALGFGLSLKFASAKRDKQPLFCAESQAPKVLPRTVTSAATWFTFFRLFRLHFFGLVKVHKA
jgi:hypothetical protein